MVNNAPGSMLRPVILCGGDGTRLWPASRKALPKQFMPLHGTTLFKQTFERSLGIPHTNLPLIICNNEHRFLAATQVQETLAIFGKAEVLPEILLEPVGRNTAPAIALAALHYEQEDPILLVLPSDHALTDPNDFYTAVKAGCEVAFTGALVTFGIIPNGPETGYGYIQQGDVISEGKSPRHVLRFIEKPDIARAMSFLDSGDYSWNSGMFLFKASVYLKELEKHAPAILEACKKSYAGHKKDLDFIRLDEKAFEASPSDSIDYAVMEHTKNACVIPLDTAWNDLGSWQNMHAIQKHDADGNTFTGDVVSVDCHNSFILSHHRLVAALGINDIVLIETPDAIMVSTRERSQDIKKIVALLKSNGRKEAEEHSRVYRPWGNYESLITGDRFQVKRLVVMPGHQLSLQRHYHRAEHWVVVRGTAQVFVNGEEKLLGEDESTYIPIGGTHRLANMGKIPLEIIEIQTGGYLGEDDIERLEDCYGR